MFVSDDATNRQLANQLGLAVAPSSSINPFIQDLIDTNAIYIGPKEEALTLYLDSRDNLEQFVGKILIIKRIYEDFCSLLGVPASEYPLRVVETEFGSLYLHCAGAAVVISLLKIGIAEFAKFIYRNYTMEGKISAMPRKFDLLKSAAKLTKEMERLGFDVSEGSEEISKANTLLNNEVSTLLEGAKSVEVDGETHPLVPDAGSKLLGNRSTKLLIDDKKSEA